MIGERPSQTYISGVLLICVFISELTCHKDLLASKRNKYIVFAIDTYNIHMIVEKLPNFEMILDHTKSVI